MKQTVRATLVQLRDTGDADSASDRMEPFFQTASEAGSDIIVFPEYILGSRISLTHNRVSVFRERAKMYHMYAIAGLIERHGDTWATTAILVDRSGEIIGRYVKCHAAAGSPPYHWPVMPGAPESAEAEGMLGHTFRTFSLDFGTIGIIQCYDGYFPESWACTSHLGAEIIFWINGREGMVEPHYCLTAAEQQCCVVGANITNGFNTGFAGPYGLGVRATGESAEQKFSYGSLYPVVPSLGDAAVHAELDLEEIRRRRKHHRMFHQRRPELYTSLLTQCVGVWRDYPDIPWIHPAAAEQANKAHL